MFQTAAKIYGTMIGANYISNEVIHPQQKLDYGFLNNILPGNRPINNQFWGTHRPINNQFWGTRAEHLFCLPAALTFFEITFLKFWASRGIPIVNIYVTPNLFLCHLYAFNWLAVGSFFVFDAYCSPLYKNEERWNQVSSKLWPLSLGMALQWHAPLMQKLCGAGPGFVGYFRNMIAISFIFGTVKSCAFGDYGNNLTPHEKIINQIDQKNTNV